MLLLSLGESRRNIKVSKIRFFVAGIIPFKEGVIGGMGCKLDKTKMETKSTEICAASKWYPIGGGGGVKTTCNALLLIYKEKKTSTTTTRDQFPGRAASQWVTFLGFFAEKYFTC